MLKNSEKQKEKLEKGNRNKPTIVYLVTHSTSENVFHVTMIFFYYSLYF